MQRGPGSPRGSGAGHLAFLLAQVGAHAAARFAERLAPLGLAPQHAGILRVLGQAAGQSQRALSERLGVLPSRLVALVDDLEARGLVERRDDADDRRSYALHLTPRGREALEEIGRVARAHGDALCAALTEPERAQLAALLGRIAEDQGLLPGVHPGLRRP
ncbi:MAG: MarR family winged helix-turn-helix transcriptional regulator [Anaeromyxobacteraceae bacterium]